MDQRKRGREGEREGEALRAGPCLECLHDLLASSKRLRLRASATLPAHLHASLLAQCESLRAALCCHGSGQGTDPPALPSPPAPSTVALREVLCPKHAGLVNERLGLDLLRRCFVHLGHQDLCRAASVCRLWSDVAGTDALWEGLLARLPCANFAAAPGDGAEEKGGGLSPMHRFKLRCKGPQWDEAFSAGARHFVTDGAAAPTSDPASVVELQDGRKTILVSSGPRLYQLVSNTGNISLDHSSDEEADTGITGGDSGDGRRQGRGRGRAFRCRAVAKALPPLRKGGGRWTVNLRRLNGAAVNAIGLAAESPRAGGTAVAWLFNTDGSDCPARAHSLGPRFARVRFFGWHGFGEVVAPSFWRLMFSMEADRLLLDCGMRKEAALPLTEQRGLLGALAAEVERKQRESSARAGARAFDNGNIGAGNGDIPASAACAAGGCGDGDVRCYLVLLLQDTKATMVDLCDWDAKE